MTEATDNPAAPVPESGRYLVVGVDGARYALPVARVREVHEAVAVTPAAGAEPGVRGWVDLRGGVTPVVDARWVLGLDERLWDASMRFVVLDLDGRAAALAVDDVDDVVDAAPGGTGAGQGPLASFVRIDGDLVGVIDADAVMPPPAREDEAS